MKRIIKTASGCLILSVACALPLISANATATRESQAPRAQSPAHQERSIRTENSTWTWTSSDDGVRLEVKIHGLVEFSDDYTDVQSITGNGSIRVTDERGGVTRKFEARTTGGGVDRLYWINGQSAAFDQDARAWLAKVLNEAVRQGGYDAPRRVQRLLRQGGPAAVLQEIPSLMGDYAKRIYFDELIKSGELDNQTVQEVLRQAGAEIHSDYEKAQLLLRVSENYLHDDRQRSIYLGAVNTIHSDYEKGRALSAILKQGNLSAENGLLVLRAVGAISSDYEKAQLLIRAADRVALDGSTQAEYLHAVTSMRSDYEKGRTVSAFLAKTGPRRETLLLALKAASSISSDYEKAQLLMKVVAAGSQDETVRTALINEARSIHSEYERGRVLSAVFK